MEGVSSNRVSDMIKINGEKKPPGGLLARLPGLTDGRPQRYD